MLVNAVSEQLKRFIVQTFPLARERGINTDDRILENGILDSLGVLDLVAFMERQFTIQVCEEELIPENFQTIERLAAFVQTKANGAV